MRMPQLGGLRVLRELGDQLVAYPKIVMIPPKGKIQVKIAPRIKKDLEDGEYVALLMLKEMPPWRLDGPGLATSDGKATAGARWSRKKGLSALSCTTAAPATL